MSSPTAEQIALCRDNPEHAAFCLCVMDEELGRLRAELAEARKDAERLKVRSIAYEDAYRIAYRATRQSHSGHWDKTGQGGRGCPECTRAQEAREQCERVLQEGIKKLAAIAEENNNG